MKKSNVLFLVIFSFYGCSSFAQSNLSLEKGSLPPKPASISNPEYVKSRQLEIAVATSSSPDREGLIVAFASEDSNNYFMLSASSFIHQVSFSPNQYLGGWPLTRWPNEFLEKEVAETYIYGTEWSELLSPPVDFMGCMQRAPLRYGDITGDGTPELVVLLSSGYSVDWNVFSTEKNKIIFSNKLNFTDAVKTEDVPAYLIPAAVDKQYQYWLKSGADEEKGAAMQPALKAYGKLYFGDFDNDESQDILVWRKLYVSRLRNDPTPGFQHIRDTLLHYKLVEGEYQPQETEEATIKSWLASRQLTWSSGYPSQSECPGEEGQFIPEMHDPLLNDPEVLPSTPTPTP